MGKKIQGFKVKVSALPHLPLYFSVVSIYEIVINDLNLLLALLVINIGNSFPLFYADSSVSESHWSCGRLKYYSLVNTMFFSQSCPKLTELAAKSNLMKK